MKANTKVFITFGILVLLIAGLYVFTDWFSKTTGYVLGENEKISLAQCLSGKEVVVYTSDTCPHCRDQKELFGEEAWSHLNNVVCDGSGVCSALRGVPAWEIGPEVYYGNRDFQNLMEISGCSLE